MDDSGKIINTQDYGHVPVMLQEVLAYLACRPGGRYLDCTVGQGGIAAAILERCGPDGMVIGIDQDADAIAAAWRRLRPFEDRVRLMKANFSDLKHCLRSLAIEKVDGVVFDLGVSSAQLDQPERGFSFMADGPLDMRMDRTSGTTAEELVNRLSEHDLADVIYRYGEERYARRIARAVVQARERKPIRTTSELVGVIQRAVPATYTHGRIHCATRTFQALRIAVNQELAVLGSAIRDAVDVLAPKGRLCVISFHSLEDRIVKEAFRSFSRGPDARLAVLTKKPRTATEEERTRNPRSRSAKLRAAERLP